MVSARSRDVILLIFANDRVGTADDYLRNLAEERRRITRQLEPLQERYRIVVESNVTRSQLFYLLRTHGERVVGVHFGGHADPEALFVEDAGGTLEGLNVAGLAGRLATMERLGWIFLNGCSTQGQIDALHARVGAPAIATECAIRDDAAAEFAEEFYANLAVGRTLEQSFEAAHDRLETYSGQGTRRFLRPAVEIEPEPESESDGSRPWRLHDPPGRPDARHWRLLDDREPSAPTEPPASPAAGSVPVEGEGLRPVEQPVRALPGSRRQGSVWVVALAAVVLVAGMIGWWSRSGREAGDVAAPDASSVRRAVDSAPDVGPS